MCDFLARFGMHGITWVISCHDMGFSTCYNIFSLAFPFTDNLDEMGSHTSVELDCQMDSKLSGVDL